MPGGYYYGRRKPTSPGDANAIRGYAGQLRKAARSLQSISDDADSCVRSSAKEWDGQWRDQFLSMWCENITANDRINARAWAQDRASFVKAHPRLARLYDANSDYSPTAFRQAINACNQMADCLDQYAHAVDQEVAQEWEIFLDVVIIVASVAATVFSFGALGPEALLLDVFLVGGAIGGVTSATIDFTNQTINNMVVNHDSFFGSLGHLDLQELASAYITGYIVGGVSSVIGIGLPRALLSMGNTFKAAGYVQTVAGDAAFGRALTGAGNFFTTAVNNTVLRIGIDAAGFGAGTFVGDVSAQEYLDLLTRGQVGPVDWGGAGRDALIATGGGVVFGTFAHGMAPDPAAAAADPTAQQWGIGISTVGEDGQRVSYFALSNAGGADFTVYEGSPVGVARELGTAKLLDGAALVGTDGGFRIDLATPNSDIMVRTPSSASWINVGQDGTPLIMREVGVSDGSITFNVVPGDSPLPPELSIDANGELRVPKDWQVVSEPPAGRVTLTAPWSSDATYTFAVGDPARGSAGAEPRLLAAPASSADPAVGADVGGSGERVPTLVVETGDLTAGGFDTAAGALDTAAGAQPAGLPLDGVGQRGEPPSPPDPPGPAAPPANQPPEWLPYTGPRADPAGAPLQPIPGEAEQQRLTAAVGRVQERVDLAVARYQDAIEAGDVPRSQANRVFGVAEVDIAGFEGVYRERFPESYARLSRGDASPDRVTLTAESTDEAGAGEAAAEGGPGDQALTVETWSGPEGQVQHVPDDMGEMTLRKYHVQAAGDVQRYSSDPNLNRYPPRATPRGISSRTWTRQRAEILADRDIQAIQIREGAPPDRVMQSGPRWHDAEFKLAQEIVQTLRAMDAPPEGTIVIGASKEMCPSCVAVLHAVQDEFPNVRVVLASDPQTVGGPIDLGNAPPDAGGPAPGPGPDAPEAGGPASPTLDQLRRFYLAQARAADPGAQADLGRTPEGLARRQELERAQLLQRQQDELGRMDEAGMGGAVRRWKDQWVTMVQRQEGEWADIAPSLDDRVGPGQWSSPEYRDLRAYFDTMQREGPPQAGRVWRSQELELVNPDGTPVTLRPGETLPVLRTRYDVVELPGGETSPPKLEITVRMHLSGSHLGVTDDELARMQRVTEIAVDHFFNEPGHLVGDALLEVRVRFDDQRVSATHFDVTARPGVGRAHETEWFVGDNFVTRAHEVGHMLGLHDEYSESGITTRDRLTPTSPGVFRDGSLMGNYWRRGVPDVRVGLKGRHLAQILQDVRDHFEPYSDRMVAADGVVRRPLDWIADRQPAPVELNPGPAAADGEGGLGGVPDLDEPISGDQLMVVQPPNGHGDTLIERMTQGGGPHLMVDGVLVDLGEARAAWLRELVEARTVLALRPNVTLSAEVWRPANPNLLDREPQAMAGVWSHTVSGKPAFLHVRAQEGASWTSAWLLVVEHISESDDFMTLVQQVGGLHDISLGNPAASPLAVRVGARGQYVNKVELKSVFEDARYVQGIVRARGGGLWSVRGFVPPREILREVASVEKWDIAASAGLAVKPLGVSAGAGLRFEVQERNGRLQGAFFPSLTASRSSIWMESASLGSVGPVTPVVETDGRVLVGLSFGSGWRTRPLNGFWQRALGWMLPGRMPVDAGPLAAEPRPPTDVAGQEPPGEAPTDVATTPPPATDPALAPELSRRLADGLAVLESLEVPGSLSGRPAVVPTAAADLGDRLGALNAAVDRYRQGLERGLPAGQLSPLREGVERALEEMDGALARAEPVAGLQQCVREGLQAVVDDASALPPDLRPPELDAAGARLQHLGLGAAVESTRAAADASRALFRLLADDPLGSAPTDVAERQRPEGGRRDDGQQVARSTTPQPSGWPPELLATDPIDLLRRVAVPASEHLMAARSTVAEVVVEDRPLSQGGFDPSTGRVRIAQRHMAALTRAWYGPPNGGEALTDEDVGALVDATTTLWHELIHGIQPGGAPATAGWAPEPDSYARNFGRNLEEGSTEWHAQATLADFAEATGILRMAGLTRERFLSGVMTDDPYAARVAMARRFAEQGGAELLGFDDVAAYRAAQAVETSTTRPGWMVDRIVRAQGLPDTPEVRGRLLDALERGFDGHLGNNSPESEGRRLADAALAALRSGVERLRSGGANPAPGAEPTAAPTEGRPGPRPEERLRPEGDETRVLVAGMERDLAEWARLSEPQPGGAPAPVAQHLQGLQRLTEALHTATQALDQALAEPAAPEVVAGRAAAVRDLAAQLELAVQDAAGIVRELRAVEADLAARLRALSDAGGPPAEQDPSLAARVRAAIDSPLIGDLERQSGDAGAAAAAARRLLQERALADPTGAQPPGLRVTPLTAEEPRVPTPSRPLRPTERVVQAEVARRIGAAEAPQFAELTLPAVTAAGQRIIAAEVSPTPAMPEEEFARAAAHRLAVIRSNAPGPAGQALARVEEQALKVAWRFEETRRVTDLLAGEPTQAARRQVPRELSNAVIDAATRIVETFDDPTLTGEARQARIRAEVAVVRAQVAGTPLADAIAFEAVEAAVDALRGTTSSGLPLLDRAGNLTVEGRPAGTLAGLLDDVAVANRANHLNGVDVEYVVNLDTPRVDGRSEVQVISRPRVFSVSPPGVPEERLPALTEGVAGRYTVEVGAGSGSFAVDMVPAAEQESGMLVQTELGEFAFKAQLRRDLRFGLDNVAPRRGPNSVVLLGDALGNMELFFGTPARGGGVRRLIINNINAHFTEAEYDTLARGLRAALAEGGQVEIQWDDSPEDAAGTPRGHIKGEPLRDALLRAGVAVEYHVEPAISYPYDVTPPGGERPGRTVPPPPDPTSPTGGRAVIRRLGVSGQGGQLGTAAGPWPTGGPAWQPSPAEANLAARAPAVPPDRFPRLPGDHMNDGYIVPLEGGGQGVFKPDTGVSRLGRQEWRGGELWRQVSGEHWEPVPPDDLRAPREVGSSRTDEMLGFDLVPTTADRSFEPYGPGSLQEWADGTGSLPVGRYGVEDQQEIAVLDYVLAHSDRGPGNYLTSPEGRPVAIDNGDTLPATDVDQRLVSPFLDPWFDRPLSDAVMAKVRSVDPDALRRMLVATGLSQAAADGAAARLEEVQRLGRIAGEAWGGAIIGERGPIRARRR